MKQYSIQDKESRAYLEIRTEFCRELDCRIPTTFAQFRVVMARYQGISPLQKSLVEIVERKL